MRNPIFSFIVISTGAFAIWLSKGFKGPFENEMVGPYEEDSKKGTIRYVLGLGIWAAILSLLSIALF